MSREAVCTQRLSQFVTLPLERLDGCWDGRKAGLFREVFELLVATIVLWLDSIEAMRRCIPSNQDIAALEIAANNLACCCAGPFFDCHLSVNLKGVPDSCMAPRRPAKSLRVLFLSFMCCFHAVLVVAY